LSAATWWEERLVGQRSLEKVPKAVSAIFVSTWCRNDIKGFLWFATCLAFTN